MDGGMGIGDGDGQWGMGTSWGSPNAACYQGGSAGTTGGMAATCEALPGEDFGGEEMEM